jgi:hypothetical protein
MKNRVPRILLAAFTASLTVPASVLAQSTPYVTGPSGTFRVFQFLTNSQRRFDIGVDNAPEAGGNSGSNFFINRFDDNGNFLGTSFSVNRASGNVGIGTTGQTAKFEVNLWNQSGWNGNLKAARFVTPDSRYYLDLNAYVDGEGNIGYHFSPNGLTGMMITTPGNVGIGTSSADRKLSITNGDDARVNIYSNGGSVGMIDSVANTNRSINRWLSINPSGGYVGIGTTTPAFKLDVKNDNYNAIRAFGSSSNSIGIYVGNQIAGGHQYGLLSSGGGPAPVGSFVIFDDQGSPNVRFVISPSGNVGIGTTNPTNKLEVNGTIRAKEVIVETTGWSDYVFAPGYKLAPLSEVEAHIASNGTLPGIPSAAEVAEKGVSVGDMQAKLLAKVEELTLHVIAQEKRIAQLEAENAALKIK